MRRARPIATANQLLAIALGFLFIAAPVWAKTFHAEGLVIKVDAARHSITISHRDIPGFMPAMEMSFNADPKEKLEDIQAGARVMFDVVVDKKQIRVRNIRVVQPPPLPGNSFAPKPSTQALQTGETVPEFSLVAQDGSTLRLGSLRGRVVLINFIYTRCPMPEACPRLSANFAYLQRLFGSRIDLISITLDPKWDEPPVLEAYARRWAADTRTWRFATGRPEEIRRVAEEFGVRYWAEEDALAHSSSVGIITPDGKLAARVDGTGYPVRELVDLVTSQLILDSSPLSP
jgi:protein SCO1